MSGLTSGGRRAAYCFRLARHADFRPCKCQVLRTRRPTGLDPATLTGGGLAVKYGWMQRSALAEATLMTAKLQDKRARG
jgi:hypothetical protein